MIHDPLCPYMPEQPGYGGINSGISSIQPYIAGYPCQCDLIAQVREDELAKCIEVIDDMVIDTVGNSAATVDQVLDALRGLQEKS